MKQEQPTNCIVEFNPDSLSGAVTTQQVIEDGKIVITSNGQKYVAQASTKQGFFNEDEVFIFIGSNDGAIPLPPHDNIVTTGGKDTLVSSSVPLLAFEDQSICVTTAHFQSNTGSAIEFIPLPDMYDSLLKRVDTSSLFTIPNLEEQAQKVFEEYLVTHEATGRICKNIEVSTYIPTDTPEAPYTRGVKQLSLLKHRQKDQAKIIQKALKPLTETVAKDAERIRKKQDIADRKKAPRTAVNLIVQSHYQVIANTGVLCEEDRFEANSLGELKHAVNYKNGSKVSVIIPAHLFTESYQTFLHDIDSTLSLQVCTVFLTKLCKDPTQEITISAEAILAALDYPHRGKHRKKILQKAIQSIRFVTSLQYDAKKLSYIIPDKKGKRGSKKVYSIRRGNLFIADESFDTCEEEEEILNYRVTIRLGNWERCFFDPTEETGSFWYGHIHPQMIQAAITKGRYDVLQFAQRVYFLMFAARYHPQNKKWHYRHTFSVEELLSKTLCLPQTPSKNTAKRLHKMLIKGLAILKARLNATVDIMAPFDDLNHPSHNGKGAFNRLLQAQISISIPCPRGLPLNPLKSKKQKRKRTSKEVKREMNRKTLEAAIACAQKEGYPICWLAEQIGCSPKTISNYRKRPESAGKGFINKVKTITQTLRSGYPHYH